MSGKVLIISGMHVRELPNISNTVEFLELYSTSIERIDCFPMKLKRLNIYRNNFITSLPELPPRLEHLQLAHLPRLTEIPLLPDTVTQIELNSLDSLIKLPSIQRGHIHLENMKLLKYLPDPSYVGISLFNCPSLEIKQTGVYDDFINEWKQFHAMR